MSDVVIRVEDVYKEYILGKIGYGTLKDDLKSWWARIRGKEDPNSIIGQQSRLDLKHKHFLALNGVSFEVKEGEAVGIIGRNGAGKSTLLKILSRITTPSRGAIKIKGRISSLLEVGTGFHPELTGRENIYLNGAILGMKKKEIDKKLDEIIGFAGIEEFIDTPVKRYSSGMYVRLAFSVAAHLDSDILILDEVLAVGDAEFQKKCLGKMDDVTKNQGRTILFVSHNMAAIKNLCSRGILLKDGKIEVDGSVDEAVSKYNKNNLIDFNNFRIEWENTNNLFDDEYLLVNRFYLSDKYGKKLESGLINNKDEVYVRIEFELKKNDPDLCIGYTLFYNDIILFRSEQIDDDESKWPKLKIGRNIIYSRIPTNLLNSGNYLLKLTSSLFNIRWIFDYKKDDTPFLTFRISDNLSNSKFIIYGKRNTIISPIMRWYSL